MSNLHRPALAGQVVSLDKSPRYWLRRAQQHRKRGEHHRAAALLRHAVSLEPESGALLMEYAQALRDMSCFEASNREAFHALALEPEGFLPYHLIGRNMLSLGREQEAADAFAHYLQRIHLIPWDALPWEDEGEDLETLLDAPLRRGTARYDALIHIASLRLVRGDLMDASTALRRAGRSAAADSRLDALYAMLYQALDQPENALSHALRSAHENPRHAPTLCALASVHAQIHRRDLAAAALMAAAPYCHFPHEEQLFCFTASALHMENFALDMLRFSRNKNPDRLPTLYNLAVALLRRGDTAEALAHLHRCRDLDPDDLTAQYALTLVTDWLENEDTPDGLRKKARQLAFYPFLPAAAEQLLLTQLADALNLGVESFAAALLQDASLKRTFLYALTLPTGSLGRLLYPIASAMAQTDPDAAQRLLRAVLVQNTPDAEVKRHALLALSQMDSEPPYVIWQNGRIMQAAPQPSTQPPITVTQRLVFKRIRAAVRIVHSKDVAIHALTLLARMSRRTRYAFAADPAHVWPSALARHFCLTRGCCPPTFHAGTPEQKRRERRAFAILCALMPLPIKEDL